jgi:hypothetical protein
MCEIFNTNGIPFIQSGKQKGPSARPQNQHSDISNATDVRHDLPFDPKRSFSVPAANLSI